MLQGSNPRYSLNINSVSKRNSTHIAQRRRLSEIDGTPTENIENYPISLSDLEMRLEALKYSNECLRKQNILLLNFCKKYDIIQ